MTLIRSHSEIRTKIIVRVVDGAMVFAKGNADTIFYGGPILTVNAKNEEVQALAVQGGKIVAVGSKDAVTKEW